MVKHFTFPPKSSFAFKILFNVNGKATVVTHPLFHKGGDFFSYLPKFMPITKHNMVTYMRHLVICSGLNRGKVRPARLLAQTYTLFRHSVIDLCLVMGLLTLLPVCLMISTVQRPTQKGA